MRLSSSYNNVGNPIHLNTVVNQKLAGMMLTEDGVSRADQGKGLYMMPQPFI